MLGLGICAALGSLQHTFFFFFGRVWTADLGTCLHILPGHMPE